jgi:hypothetical protein
MKDTDKNIRDIHTDCRGRKSRKITQKRKESSSNDDSPCKLESGVFSFSLNE